MTLMVSPKKLRTITEVRIDSGMEIAMMSVLRQLPKKEQDHQAREAGGDNGFSDHPADGGADEDRLIGQRLNLHFWRQRCGDAWKQRADAVHDVERGRVPALSTLLLRRAGRRGGPC